MDIDFVVLWVDGADENWLKEKNEYSLESVNYSDKNRFRDWGNLQYWFRGVEKFAPWVRKVHFITWGHLPNWLNKNNPKINIIKHEQYIPREYLPTFNSHTIELNINKIDDLAENFVYFNDDMFITKSVEKEDFFKNGLPCDMCALDLVVPFDLFSHILFNNIKIVNKHFEKHDVISKNFFKWFNLKNGKHLRKTLKLNSWNSFTGFVNPHLPIAFNKKNFNELWKLENEILKQTCLNKFRSKTDVNIWLVRYWQIIKGDFYPSKASKGKFYSITDNKISCNSLYDDIVKQRYKMLCINDNASLEVFEYSKKSICKAFEKILSEKSSFEV